MPYRKINIYECLGTSANSASTPIKMGINADVFNHIIVTGYPNNVFPMNVSVQRGVDRVMKLIQQNPGDFVLVGTSQGAIIMSEVFKQIRTWPRYSDCVGVFLFGNPEREGGRAFPGCPAPTGHGIMPSSSRLTDTPDLVWEFANPGDPICTTLDTTAGVQATNAFQTLFQVYSGLEKNLTGTLLGFWQTLKGMVNSHNVYALPTWKPLSGTSPVSVGGVEDNNRSGQKIVIDQLNNVIGPEHAEDYSYTTPTFTPPDKKLYICTTTTTTTPQLKDIYSLGFNVRIVLPWSLIQPSSNQYSWSPCDNVINSALAAGLQPLVVLSTPAPSWATPLSQYATTFGTMATAFANRYKPNGSGITTANSGKGVTEYQIWNEPNVIENWPTGVSSAQYTAYLKAAYTGIKSAYSGATVIFGGLQSCSDQKWTQGNTVTAASRAQVTTLSYVNREPSGFLSECYTAGAKNYFDVMAFHPLSIGTRQTPTPPPPGTAMITPSDTVYKVMSANGDSAKKMYWSAMGYDTANFTEIQQSDYLDTLRWLANERAYVSGLAIYGYSD